MLPDEVCQSRLDVIVLGRECFGGMFWRWQSVKTVSMMMMTTMIIGVAVVSIPPVSQACSQLREKHPGLTHEIGQQLLEFGRRRRVPFLVRDDLA